MEMELPSKKLYDRWNNEETIKLIYIYEALFLDQIFDGTVRDSEAYKKVVCELANEGIIKTTAQVRSKLKALKKKYKEVKDGLRVSGAGGNISFPYFDLMDKFLGNRDNINPVISADIGFEPLDSENVTLDDCDASGAIDDIFSGSMDYEQVSSNNISITKMSNLPSSTPKNKGRKRKNQYEEALGKVLGDVTDKLLNFEQKMEEKAEIFRQKMLAQTQEMMEILKQSVSQKDVHSFGPQTELLRGQSLTVQPSLRF